jgi:two-component system chemotaxis response regulator CheB
MNGSHNSSDKTLLPAGTIKVMLVDDSSVVRGLLTRILETDPQIKIIATAGNGQTAIDSLKRIKPDIIILDIEMPVMDGITALPLLLQESPGSKVLICSTLSLRNAEITLKALAMGATDTIAKPTAAGQIINDQNDFKNNLINLVKQIGTSTVKRWSPSSPTPTPVPSSTGTADMAIKLSTTPKVRLYAADITLRDIKTAYQGKPEIIAIGSSTGGPQALFKVLENCKGMDIPIVITQHMPPTFTAMLALHIQQHSGLPAAEGKDGELLKPGHVYVAPGGMHMTIERENMRPVIRLNTNPPENFCRPAVDPMFRSLSKSYGNKILGIILTGMGSDGKLGGEALVNAGSRLYAQDEATSVVWGMPGAAATAGICHGVLPLADIGPLIQRLTLLR